MIQSVVENEYALGDITEIRELGGLSSVNRLLVTSTGRYVIKHFKDSDAHRADLISDQYNRLEHLGIRCPKLLHTTAGKAYARHAGGTYLILTFLDGVILHDSERLRTNMSSIAGALAATHAKLKLIVGKDLDRWPTAKITGEEDLARSNKGCSAILERIQSLRDTKLKLIDRIGQKAVPPGTIKLIHGDLHNENIVFEDGSSDISFLDWERSRPGVQSEDAATFGIFAFCNFSFESSNVATLWNFLADYGQRAGSHDDELKLGVALTLLRMLKSSFIESLVIQDPSDFSLGLLARDELRFSHLAEHPNTLAGLLGDKHVL